MGLEFLGNVVLKGEIECKTGLHIGDEGSIEIGGVGDNPVVKDPVEGYPYIPGSSIKGKMRSLLEWDEGVVDEDGSVHECEDSDCTVCRVFGTSANVEVKNGPTRISVRDAHPTDETIEMWRQMNTDLPYTELKSENTIDRVTSEATPREMERVPKGSEFEYEIVYSIYDLGDGGQKDLENLSAVERSLILLEESSLGGSGSRGYGKVEFKGDGFRVKTKGGYAEVGAGDTDEETQKAETVDGVGDILGVSDFKE